MSGSTHALRLSAIAEIGFARLIRELDLDLEPPRDNRIGPIGLRSNRRL